MKELLRELVSLSGPSGFESTISNFISHKIRPFVDEIRLDVLGNLIAIKRGSSLKGPVLLNAHLDEVGFIVRKIEDNGFLRFEKLGRTNDQILPARLIRLHTARGTAYGVVGALSAHLVSLGKEHAALSHQDLYIDVGARSKAEVLQLGIEIGTAGVFAGELHDLGQHRAAGKSLDNRVGCAVLVTLLERLHGVQLNGDLYAAFTVQEEVGLRGASIVSYDLDPSAAISVDTTVATDTLEEMMDERIRLGNGPVVQLMDAGMISDPVLRTILVQLARNLNIPFQLGVTSAGRTDSAEIQRTKRGVRTGVLSVPCRYTHSPVEVIDLMDLEQTAELLFQFVMAFLSSA